MELIYNETKKKKFPHYLVKYNKIRNEVFKKHQATKVIISVFNCY